MDEILDLVDENDVVIGQIERNEAHRIHAEFIRGIHIFLTLPNGKIIVPLRSANRRIRPNCYDYSVCGHVDSGYGYHETAYKEMREEMGITDITLKEIGYWRPSDYGNGTHYFFRLYLGQVDCDISELNYDRDGIAELHALSVSEIFDLLQKSPERFMSSYKKEFKFAVEKGYLK